MILLYFLAIKICQPGITTVVTGLSIFKPAAFCQPSISVLDHVPDELVSEK